MIVEAFQQARAVSEFDDLDTGAAQPVAEVLPEDRLGIDDEAHRGFASAYAAAEGEVPTILFMHAADQKRAAQSRLNSEQAREIVLRKLKLTTRSQADHGFAGEHLPNLC